MLSMEKGYPHSTKLILPSMAFVEHDVFLMGVPCVSCHVWGTEGNFQQLFSVHSVLPWDHGQRCATRVPSNTFKVACLRHLHVACPCFTRPVVTTGTIPSRFADDLGCWVILGSCWSLNHADLAASARAEFPADVNYPRSHASGLLAFSSIYHRGP